MLVVRWSILAALILFAAQGRAEGQLTVEPTGSVLVPQSESFVVRSHARGETYRISVGLPLSYGQEPGKRFPVLYVVDADVNFASAVEVTRFLALVGEIPEVIVVGIGYGTDLATWRTRRGVDLKPESTAEPPGSGRASQFLDFIAGEVIPLVESRYLCSEDRALFGYSLGGLFGTYVLFHRAGTFQKYILGSPSYGSAGRVALQWPAAVDGTAPAPTGVVFTSVGTEESQAMIANWRAFWDDAEALEIPGLRIIRGEVDETHAGAAWHAFVKGVKAVWQ
jgi:uncharacterized protein